MKSYASCPRAEVELRFSADDPRLQVLAGRSRFNLPVLPAGDFPVMSSDGLSGQVRIETSDLIRLIDKTRFAISTEETRYYLNGLYLHTVVEEGRTLLRAVATDGRRLALAEMTAPEGCVGAPGVIVPRKTIQEVRRLLEDAGEFVELQVSAQKVRSLAAPLPDLKGHRRLLPRLSPGDPARQPEGSDDRQRPVRLGGGPGRHHFAEKSRSVKMSAEPGRVTLTVRNMEAGQAVEEIEVDYDGEASDIGFNASSTTSSVAGQIHGETAEFRFSDLDSPTLVLDPADADVRYVLMPLRV